MATRLVFDDENDNEMNCYLNQQGKVYISISKNGEDIAYSGFITLEKTDVQKLITVLEECEKEMES